MKVTSTSYSAEFSGTTYTPQMSFPKGEEVKVWFTSDFSEQYQGFSAAFQIKPVRSCEGTNFGGVDCCTAENPCPEGEADCDSDSDCQYDLICGTDNCQNYWSFYSSIDDCCTVCPSGWSHDNGRCYYFSQGWDIVWYSQLTSKCSAQNSNAKPVSIHSMEQQNFIMDKMDWGADYHIGLTDQYTEGSWRWMDGSPYDFSYWAPGEPNNAVWSEHWAMMRKHLNSGQWVDINGVWLGRYICAFCPGGFCPPTGWTKHQGRNCYTDHGGKFEGLHSTYTTLSTCLSVCKQSSSCSAVAVTRGSSGGDSYGYCYFRSVQDISKCDKDTIYDMWIKN